MVGVLPSLPVAPGLILGVRNLGIIIPFRFGTGQSKSRSRRENDN